MVHMSVKVYSKNFFAIVISMVHDAKSVYFKGRIIIYARAQFFAHNPHTMRRFEDNITNCDSSIISNCGM